MSLQYNQKILINNKQEHSQCPYLGQIRRHLLDFDFEKVCSLSLLNNNVYGCLICGRYFNGKGPKTAAYEHSIQYNHYLYINLNNGCIYCLPDNYQVISHTLNDIKFNLKPQYTKKQLQQFYKLQPEYNIDGKQYIPGFIGMNNLGMTDYANTIYQILNIIPQFRQFMLINSQFHSPLLQTISLFYKKIWNNKNFKGVISPHQLLQTITHQSNKIFKIGKMNDPSSFFIWLINTLDKLIKKQKQYKNKLSILKLFQGQVKTSFIRGIKNSSQYQRIPQKVETKNFIILKVQFPQKGIFNKTKNQTPLSQMMQKYSGLKEITSQQGLNYMRIIGFPQYLVLVFKRFNKTEYKFEKDSSQVIYNGSLQIQGRKYRLQGQICHEGQYQGGKFISYVCFNQRWFMAEDLNVREVLKKDMLLGQPYMQFYKYMV